MYKGGFSWTRGVKRRVSMLRRNMAMESFSALFGGGRFYEIALWWYSSLRWKGVSRHSTERDAM